MLNICLCDDNPVIINKYKNLITKIAAKAQLPVHIAEFFSGEQLVFYLENGPAADIIYLDILMEGRNGLETAKKLRESGCLAEIIFLTANPEYVFDAFDVSPVNYLVKGTTSEERFCEIFLKAASFAAKKTKEVFSCESGAIKKQIPFSEISYFEVRNRVVTVHYQDNAFHFYASLEEVLENINSTAFIRIHRSYLVHLSYIEQLSKDAVLMTSGVTLPLGITYAKNVKQALSHFLDSRL